MVENADIEVAGPFLDRNILAIDTVSDVCSIAVSNEGKIYQLTEKGQKNHSRKILGMVSEALGHFGLESQDIDHIVVDIGPGSFTGVRIGLGIAQGLAYARGIKVYGVCSLEVLAHSAGQGMVLSAMDARMGQVYCGLYDVGEEKCPDLLSEIVVVDPLNVPTPKDKFYTAIGNGWVAYDKEMKSVIGNGVFATESNGFPEARYAIEIAARRTMDSAINATDLRAFYVRNHVAEKTVNRPVNQFKQFGNL